MFTNIFFQFLEAGRNRCLRIFFSFKFQGKILVRPVAKNERRDSFILDTFKINNE